MPSMDTGWVGATWENQTDISDEVLLPSVRETARHLEQWVRETRGKGGRGSLFDRTRFVVSDNPFDQMVTARAAVSDDDIVSTAADVTESLIFQGAAWESKHDDAADIFNQWNAEVDLDAYLRVYYRELFTYSQCITATWWGTKQYISRVRGAVDAPADMMVPGQLAPKKPKQGPRKRKVYELYVPTRVETLDPTKVVPIGNSIFGPERLAWHATAEELGFWAGIYDGLNYDAVMTELFIGKYTPGPEERALLSRLNVNPDRLIELNPQRVWRHSLTKSAYEMWPINRMKSIFPLLDLKQQLMESDRVSLVGAANYILLVRKGSESQPAAQPEIDNLKEGFQVLAKLPVIVSDHRLDITIITPKLDVVLNQKKYDTLDKRILSRLFGLVEVSSATGDGTTGIVTRIMARVLENRRRMIRRSIEEHVLSAVWDHPRNKEQLKDIGLDEKPSLAFTPRNVQVDSDAQIISAIAAARASRDLSRESYLEALDFDQAVEARRMEREAEMYDSIFKTHTPFDGVAGDGSGGVNPNGAPVDPNAPVDPKAPGEPPAVSGARGGRPVGGGKSPQSIQGTVRPKTSTGVPSVGGNK